MYLESNILIILATTVVLTTLLSPGISTIIGQLLSCFHPAPHAADHDTLCSSQSVAPCPQVQAARMCPHTLCSSTLLCTMQGQGGVLHDGPLPYSPLYSTGHSLFPDVLLANFLVTLPHFLTEDPPNYPFQGCNPLPTLQPQVPPLAPFPLFCFFLSSFLSQIVKG